MKILVTISRIITGIVFTFSGFVKAVDPVGTEIKLGDYFEAMGLDFLMPYALIFALLLNTAELTVGIMLLFNLLPKLSSWVALIFLIIFTPLTLWLAVENPVTDCGCFGDAIKLTNWQTFGKNIILLILVIMLFVYAKNNSSKIKLKKPLIISIIIAFLALGFQFKNLKCLPPIDFRPFKKGVNIKKASSTPENAKKDVYETILFYKNIKTGERKEFNINNIPYEDTLTWKYDTTINKLISKGYEPPIHDFFLTDLKGNDITNQILNDKKVSYIMILHKFKEGINKIDNSVNEIAKYANENNLNFYCFTSSGKKEIDENKNRLPQSIIICTADYKMLKTFVRKNPSFVVLENAIIKEKVPFGKAKKKYKINKK